MFLNSKYARYRFFHLLDIYLYIFVYILKVFIWAIPNIYTNLIYSDIWSKFPFSLLKN